MSDSDEILQFVVPVTETPEPEDYETEVATATAILDLCEKPGAELTSETIQNLGRITPWVAWQLGIVAEVAAANNQGVNAVKIATASIIAAYLCRSIPRLYANLLTAGNVFLRLGEHTEALTSYQRLLRLPFHGGVGERAAAHLGIGSIYSLHLHDPRKAIYHYEHGMRYVGPRSEEAHLVRFWHGTTRLYREAEDYVGGVLCLCQAKHPMAATAIEETITGSLERTLALRSRLLRQGNLQMADQVMKIRLKEGT